MSMVEGESRTWQVGKSSRGFGLEMDAGVE